MKLWEKECPLNQKIEKFTVGNDYILDKKLVKYDCKASIAHAEMLNKIDILSKKEKEKIIACLNKIIKIESKNKFKIKAEDEDCHTAIENFLIEKLGDIGKKIHTGRSRNDQVLTTLRLYYKDELEKISVQIDQFINRLCSFKRKYGEIKYPGYTHMRKAMPSTINMWAESFIDSMEDNKIILKTINKLIDQCPLGTGAGYGIPMDIDRKLISNLLGFSKYQKNPIYVQNSRGKFESSILHVLSQIMFDLNKISNDIILFSINEFGYFALPSDILTGSSIMPHKKNPDVFEIVRANYHQIIALEFEAKSIISNLISGYNRDIQLIKKSIMDGFNITNCALNAMILIFEKIKINRKACKKGLTRELFATEELYKLVKNGVSFREAYKIISKNY